MVKNSRNFWFIGLVLVFMASFVNLYFTTTEYPPANGVDIAFKGFDNLGSIGALKFNYDFSSE